MCGCVCMTERESILEKESEDALSSPHKGLLEGPDLVVRVRSEVGSG